MNKFDIGDRVVCIEGDDGVHYDGNIKIRKGMIGIVCRYDDNRPGIYFEEHIQGHSCDGRCTSGHGWYIDEDSLELCNEEEYEPDKLDLTGFIHSILCTV